MPLHSPASDPPAATPNTARPAAHRSGRGAPADAGAQAAAVIATIAASRRRTARWTILLSVALATSAAAAAGIGPVAVDPVTVARIIGHHVIGVPATPDWSPAADAIVWGTRAPRVAMAVVAGAVLALAGATLQAVVRNALADPYVLGLNAGASAGAAAALLLGGGGALILSGSSLLGALVATALVLLLAGAAGERGPGRLVLAGLAVGYALTAVTSFLIFWSDSPEAARAVLFWLLGSLTAVHPETLAAAAIACAVAIAGLMAAAPLIDALASGDDSAIAAGINPERARFGLMAGVSAVVGVVVAGIGGVGFVGLVVPHLARRLVGGTHRAVLPVAALLGAILLLAADTVARTAFAPHEIPVGVITGVVGAPFLLALLRPSRAHRRRRGTPTTSPTTTPKGTERP